MLQEFEIMKNDSNLSLALTDEQLLAYLALEESSHSIRCRCSKRSVDQGN